MSTSTSPIKKLPLKTNRVNVACQTDTAYASPLGSYAAACRAQAQLNATAAAKAKAPSNPAQNGKAKTVPKEHPRNAASSSTSEGSSSEGTLVLKIQQFSKMCDTLSSPSKRISGVPWRIMVMPKQHMVQKKSQKCMGFFLQCCPDKTYSDAWSCKADAEMRLVSRKQGASNFVRKTSHTYTSKENDWGYSCFMTWADVLDENQGYIENDQVTLEITVKADLPKNMMSREDFCKSIDQWYNLAEMQMGRGLIDLSIEANAQALKFCKDKDMEMKKKLEEQKERLVKKKVVDSINRIEQKTDAVSKVTEPLKPTSLRQALTGAQKTIAAKGCAKAPAKKDRRATLQQLKKKKQDLASKEKELKRKTAEWEEVNSQLSMSSEEGRTPSSPQSPPDSPPPEENCPVPGSSRQSSVSSCCTECMMSCPAPPMSPGGKKSNAPSVHACTCSLCGKKGSACSRARQTARRSTPLPRMGDQPISEETCRVFRQQLAQYLAEHPPQQRSDGSLKGALEFEVSGTGPLPHEDIVRAIKENLEMKLHGGPAGDDESCDNSEDYREDDSMHEACDQCSATGPCIHDSLSSLEGETESLQVTENGCQTEETGEPDFYPPAAVTGPQPNPRRERRHAGSGMLSGDLLSMSEVLMRQMKNFTGDTDEVIRSVFAHDNPKNSEIDRQKLVQFCNDCFGVDNLDIAKELEAALSVIERGGVDLPSLSANVFTRLDTLSDDHGTCCLVAGLCTVQSRRIIQSASEFCKLASELYNDETGAVYSQVFEQDGTTGTDTKPKETKGKSAVQGRKLATAVRRRITSPVLARAVIRPLSEERCYKECDCCESHSPYEPRSPVFDSSDGNVPHPFELEDVDYYIPPTPNADALEQEEGDCEKSIRGLLEDIGNYQVDHLINEKIDAMGADGSHKALYQLLSQLFGYSQALATTGDRLEDLVDAARRMEKLHQGSNGINNRTTEVLRKSEEKLAESEKFIKKLGTEHLKEVELRKKVQAENGELKAQLKAERERHEQTQGQLRETRNQLKKADKKSKQEENRALTIQSEKSELEDKFKTVRKEFDQFKKKHAEERAKTKKERERESDLLRRCETELADRESEYQRDKQVFDEKMQQMKNNCQKLEKDRKQQLSNLAAQSERVRTLEATLLQTNLNVGMEKLEQSKKDIETGLAEAEDNLKRARTCDIETMRRSVGEWRAASEAVDKLIADTRKEHEAAIELVSKGTKTMAQFADLAIPPPPVLPKVVRLPPVQVVQPSTPVVAPPPPTISQPPAGVIGQPRTPQPNRYNSPVAGRAEVHSPSPNNPAPSALFAPPPSAASPLHPPQATPLKLQPIGTPRKEETPPAASPWSWSTPLGNLSDMIRPVSEPQHPGGAQQQHEQLWNNHHHPHHMEAHNQMRAAYGQPPMGWTPHGNWRPGPPQSQQQHMRNPGPPYYES